MINGCVLFVYWEIHVKHCRSLYANKVNEMETIGHMVLKGQQIIRIYILLMIAVFSILLISLR